MSYIPILKAFIKQANSNTHENSSTQKPPTLKPTKNSSGKSVKFWTRQIFPLYSM